MPNLEIFIATFDDLITAVSTEPAASAAVGAVFGAFLILVLSLLLLRSKNRKYIGLQEKMDRQHKSLVETIAQKNRRLEITKQICEKQKEELANTHEQIARLEESVKKTPILEEKIDQQLRQIEALTETISNEFNFDNGSAPTPDSLLFREETGESKPTEAVIDHLSTRLYQQLSSLHQQIADQSQLINELQTELNVKKETLAQQLIAKSQQLPNIAKATVGERIIEPIQLRVDGFKQTVKAIPLRTRVKIDQVVVDPINRRVKEIKAGIGRIPVETSARLNKMVVEPMHDFIGEMNRAVKNLSLLSREKFDDQVTKKLQDLAGQTKMRSRSLSRETRENMNRTIVRPIENLLTEIKEIARALPGPSGDKFDEHILRPAIQKIQAISESGKQASIQRIKNAGNWIIDTATRRSSRLATQITGG